MSLTPQVEKLPHAGGFIASEANGAYCREKITVINGQVLRPGTVLGKIAKGAATPAAVAGNTGTGTIGAVTVLAGSKPGVYRLTCIEPGTDAGKFLLTDPDGLEIGVATVAVAFSNKLGFTIADATDFVAGDSFTITVAAKPEIHSAGPKFLVRSRAILRLRPDGAAGTVHGC
jgi:hypothetical protein